MGHCFSNTNSPYYNGICNLLVINYIWFPLHWKTLDKLTFQNKNHRKPDVKIKIITKTLELYFFALWKAFLDYI